jgi:hypothetical protein
MKNNKFFIYFFTYLKWIFNLKINSWLPFNLVPDLQLFGLAKARLKLSQKRSLISPYKHQPPTTGTFKALPGMLQSQFSICNQKLTKLIKYEEQN